MPRKKKMENPGQLSLLDMIIEEQEKGGGVITSMLAIKPPQDVWRGILAVPPGTLVQSIVAEFDAKTNIPLELPFFAFFHFLAGALLHRHVDLVFDDPRGDAIRISPDIWTVLLADSGSGKSFTTSTIQRGIPELKDTSYDMAGIASTARFIEDLQENNRKLFIRDEFNELYKQLNGNISGPLAELKDILLRLYNNDTITRKRKKKGEEADEVIVPDAAIAFLGMTVTKSFSSSLTADDLINGWAQRYSYIIAKKDPNKRMIDYPIYSIDTQKWDEKWQKMMNSIKHQEYIAGKDALDAFIESFQLLANADLDESFYRRQMWKAHKYALIYHILQGKGEFQTVEADSYGWAARMVHLLLQDCVILLEEHGWSEIESKIQKVEALKERMKAEGKEMTVRDVVRRIRAINTISEAKAIISVIDLKTISIGGENPSKGKLLLDKILQ